jgi:hypothetical protein
LALVVLARLTKVLREQAAPILYFQPTLLREVVVGQVLRLLLLPVVLVAALCAQLTLLVLLEILRLHHLSKDIRVETLAEYIRVVVVEAVQVRLVQTPEMIQQIIRAAMAAQESHQALLVLL